jgi:hypothetical protein
MKERIPVDEFELRKQFNEEFFEEFQYDSVFRMLFFSMRDGLTPFEAIEHLCKSNKETCKMLEYLVLHQKPKPIIVKTEETTN